MAQQIATAFGTSTAVRSPWQENTQTGTSMEILLRDCVVMPTVMPANVGTQIPICIETTVDDFEAVRDLKGILVVEDEQFNRMVMQAKLSGVKKLTGCDAELVFVPTAEEGLALVSANMNRFGLLLVDEHLLHDGVAGMLGSDMIRAARSLGYDGTVISVSGNCMPADSEKYKCAGANLTWPKPYPSPLEMARSISSTSTAIGIR